MGFDFSFPDTLEKYGLIGLFAFAALAISAAVLWHSVAQAAETYRKQRRKKLKAVALRPCIAGAAFLAALAGALLVIASTRWELQRAALLVEGYWRYPEQDCRYKAQYLVNSSAGTLTVQIPRDFGFIFDVEVVGESSVQVRPRGPGEPLIYQRRGNRLIEKTLSGSARVLERCS